ncbi:hypothetical protein GN958_ATG06887 [Phytophthora infestans]|uniref:Uncharacterized protein n=1 Tax=Phytophthora infestans TaxID=4787 RepID=A0A8S9V0N5_PHYIN|nr:hypothetical protein GN958_ATG06887 [Phytophthora infestans]
MALDSRDGDSAVRDSKTPDANRAEVRNGRTRSRRRNTKRKRRWTELHEDGFEIAGSVQGKSETPGGLTATECDTTSSLVQGKSEEARENENEELATGEPPEKPVGAGTTEKEEKTPAVLSEPAVSGDASERTQQPKNAVAESPQKRLMSSQQQLNAKRCHWFNTSRQQFCPPLKSSESLHEPETLGFLQYLPSRSSYFCK